MITKQQMRDAAEIILMKRRLHPVGAAKADASLGDLQRDDPERYAEIMQGAAEMLAWISSEDDELRH